MSSVRIQAQLVKETGQLYASISQYNITYELFNLNLFDHTLKQICKLPTREVACNTLATFANELQAVLTVIISDKKINQIKKILNGMKFTPFAGSNIERNAFLYIKPKGLAKIEVDCSRLKSFISALQLLAQGENGIKKFNENFANALITIQSQRAAELAKLKSNYTTLPPFLDSLEKIIQDVNKKMMALYECSTPLISTDYFIMILENGKRMSAATFSDETTRVIIDKLVNRFSNKSAIYFLGDGSKEYDHLQFAIHSKLLIDLNAMRNFLLSYKNIENQLTELDEHKHKILAEFNLQFKDLLDSLAKLQDEKKYEELIEEASNAKDRLILPPTQATSSISFNRSTPAIEITIVTKQIKAHELKEFNGIKYTLIHENPVLIFEAELAHRVGKIKNALQIMQQVFANTPNHLETLDNEPSESDIQLIENEQDALQIKYTNQLDIISKEPFFENDTSWLTIVNLIKNEIPADLRIIKENFSNHILITANVKILKKKIYNAEKMLDRFIESCPHALSIKIELTEQYNEIDAALIKFQTKLDNIRGSFTALKKDGVDRSALLNEINGLIDLMTINLNTTRKAFDKHPKLNNSNELQAAGELVKLVKSHLQSFEDNAALTTEKISQATILLANADLARRNLNAQQANNRHRKFSQRGGSARSDSASQTPEEKKERGVRRV
jgi:hypothetical protein